MKHAIERGDPILVGDKGQTRQVYFQQWMPSEETGAFDYAIVLSSDGLIGYATTNRIRVPDPEEVSP